MEPSSPMTAVREKDGCGKGGEGGGGEEVVRGGEEAVRTG